MKRRIYRLMPKFAVFGILVILVFAGADLDILQVQNQVLASEQKLESNRQNWMAMQLVKQVSSDTTSGTAEAISSGKSTPLIGVYLPEFPPESNLTNFEAQIGAKVQVISWYQHWSQPAVTTKLQIVCKLNAIPLITWESWAGASNIDKDPYPLARIANGDFDPFVTDYLSQIEKTCGGRRVLIRFDHEMNTEPGTAIWYPWQGNPAAYTAAWNKVVSIARTVAPDVKFVWSPAWGDKNAAHYFPNPDLVDYTGLTVLNFWSPTVGTWHSFQEYYEPQVKVLNAFGKPVMLAEVASAEGINPLDKAVWISDMFKYIRTRPEIMGLVWYNEYHSRQFDNVVWRLDSSPAALAAFKAGMSAP